jgi:hypothetical protein
MDAGPYEVSPEKRRTDDDRGSRAADDQLEVEARLEEEAIAAALADPGDVVEGSLE